MCFGFIIKILLSHRLLRHTAIRQYFCEQGSEAKKQHVLPGYRWTKNAFNKFHRKDSLFCIIWFSFYIAKDRLYLHWHSLVFQHGFLDTIVYSSLTLDCASVVFIHFHVLPASHLNSTRLYPCLFKSDMKGFTFQIKCD